MRQLSAAIATRLPAYAPALQPDEGLWTRLKEGERRHVGGFNWPHLRAALRDAVQRVRRNSCLIHGYFQGAEL
jgi:hypothetical protein